MAFRDKQCSRPTCHRAAQALPGLVAGLVARFDGFFGALVWTGACYWHGVGGFMFNSSSSWILWGWLADMGPRCGSRLCRSPRRPSGDWRTGVLLEFRLSHHCTTGLDRAPCSLPHCLASSPRLEGHHPAGRAMADPAQHKRETAPGLAGQWRHGDVICLCVSASCATAGACTLLGPYPQAYRAS